MITISDGLDLVTKVKVEATFNRSDLGPHRRAWMTKHQWVNKYAAYFLVKRASLKILSVHCPDTHKRNKLFTL